MKAMDSGLTGAVALRTSLARPERADLAMQFHADNEHGLSVESAARTAGFCAEERRFADRPFWGRRSGHPPARRPRLRPRTRRSPGSGIHRPAA